MNEQKQGFLSFSWGVWVTAWARINLLENLIKLDKYVIYADTDSIHCDLLPEEIVGIKVDPKAFCCWKLESSWDKAIFVAPQILSRKHSAADLKL